MAETGAHLVGVGCRQLLRVAKQWPIGPNGDMAVGAKKCGTKAAVGGTSGGRALIGTTFACSAMKGAKSALHHSPLYVQVPSAYKTASSFSLPCSNRRYPVSPSASQFKTRPCSFPSASHSTKNVVPSVDVATPTHAERLAMLPA
jgi:hypothetical protein